MTKKVEPVAVRDVCSAIAPLKVLRERDPKDTEALKSHMVIRASLVSNGILWTDSPAPAEISKSETGAESNALVLLKRQKVNFLLKRSRRTRRPRSPLKELRVLLKPKRSLLRLRLLRKRPKKRKVRMRRLSPALTLLTTKQDRLRLRNPVCSRLPRLVLMLRTPRIRSSRTRMRRSALLRLTAT